MQKQGRLLFLGVVMLVGFLAGGLVAALPESARPELITAAGAAAPDADEPAPPTQAAGAADSGDSLAAEPLTPTAELTQPVPAIEAEPQVESPVAQPEAAPAAPEPEPEPAAEAATAPAAAPEIVDEPAVEQDLAGERLTNTDAHDTIEVDVHAAQVPDPPAPASSTTTETVEVDVYDPWYPVRMCESTNRYDINTGNGFYGAYQFTISTWNWVAGLIGRDDLVGVRPDRAAPADQDRLADALAFEVPGGGLHHWPVCGRHYGA